MTKTYRVTWNTGHRTLITLVKANRPEDAVKIMRQSAPHRGEVFEAVETCTR
jgi:hypothetical protein